MGVVNTPVDRACTDELVEFLTIIGQQWLTGPFTVNRVLDLETLRTLTTKDLMDMNIAQHPCDFLFQKLAERDQARAGARLVSASSSGQAMRCVSVVHFSCVRLLQGGAVGGSSATVTDATLTSLSGPPLLQARA